MTNDGVLAHECQQQPKKSYILGSSDDINKWHLINLLLCIDHLTLLTWRLSAFMPWPSSMTPGSACVHASAITARMELTFDETGFRWKSRAMMKVFGDESTPA
ncbi:hypothetical protein PGT21_009168 [Puccinia graminis f. sp. tritici]|uniref:Uncharacterized protein n=1 Tax=Puccinia graminis f. sp. tritici TaxID=56615 RepID=A0A5B0MT87_PUCGR|nr:hypothetical protein PGT21_009168 [Puccinia graminis f. sp. tritici]